MLDNIVPEEEEGDDKYFCSVVAFGGDKGIILGAPPSSFDVTKLC